MTAAILAVAISLSIGWGIRGNFGHEYGAMIAGVLSSLASASGSDQRDVRWFQAGAVDAYYTYYAY